MTEVLDVSRNEDGEITQFLILEKGQPRTKRGSPENLLLYDPNDELPFDGGMADFLSGDGAYLLSEEPRVVVAQGCDEYSYVLSVDNVLVETTPTQADEFLQGVYDAISDDDFSGLNSLHESIMSNQVRRELINLLVEIFDESHRIEITQRGWIVDGFYLVDWKANLYAKDNDPDEADYVRESGGVTKDKSYELVQLELRSKSISKQSITVGDEEYEISEREVLFLSKIAWLLDRRHYHPDKPFWDYCDRWTEVEEEEPDMDVFDI